MRIVAGFLKGSKISSPKNDFVRPTADKVKEAVFNIIGNLEGVIFLDLFAGSGNIGIEAVSRHAGQVVFVDALKENWRSIKADLERLKITNAEVMYSDSLAAIKNMSKAGRKFDYIYIDPPYNSDLDVQALRILTEYDIMNDNCLIIVEHKAKKDLQINEKSFIIDDARQYGNVYLTFLKKNNQNN